MGLKRSHRCATIAGVGILTASIAMAATGITATAATATEMTPAHPVMTSAWGVRQGSIERISTRVLNSRAGGATSSISTDDLDVMTALLDALPEDIKNVDPATTPDYQERLTTALEIAMTEQRTAVQAAYGVGVDGRLGINWIACAAALAGVVIQYGIPVAKVVGWFRKARSLYGDLKGIMNAIRSHHFTAQMGTEAAKVLEGILGIDGVIKHCI